MARLPFFIRLSLVFLLTLITLSTAAPAPVDIDARDFVFTLFGHPITIHSPGGNNNNNHGHDGGKGNNAQPPTTTKVVQKTTQVVHTTPAPPATHTTAAPTKQTTSQSTHSTSSSSHTTAPGFPSIPATSPGLALATGTGTSTESPAASPSSTSAASNQSATQSFEHDSNLAVKIVIPVLVLLAILIATAFFFHKKRRDTRDADHPFAPMAEKGGSAVVLGPTAPSNGGGTWNRLDMASRGDMPVAPFDDLASVGTTTRTTSPVDNRPYSGSNSTTASLSLPHHPYAQSPEPEVDITDFIGAQSAGAAVSSVGHSAHDGHSPFGPAFPPVPPMPESDDGHYPANRSQVGHDAQSVAHGSIFADPPFNPESPLHWQDEPALAESRPTSMDAQSQWTDAPPVPEVPNRESTMLAYDRDSVVYHL